LHEAAVAMADLCSCVMCVLAFLTMKQLAVTTSKTTSVVADLNACLRQDLQPGFTEWNPEAYRQHGCVVIDWNVSSQTVSVCFHN